MPKNKKFKQDPAATIGSFSKNLLGLKFMQRAKKQVEKSVEEKDGGFDISLCKNMKSKQQFIINHSYQFCERLKFGRLSFKGMNGEIETIMFNNRTDKDTPSSSSEKRGPPPSDTSSDNEIDNLNSEDDDERDEDILE